MSLGGVSLGINWKEVAVVPNIYPEGNFVFQLLGGKIDDKGRVVVSTTFADGELVGKRFSYSYPNFETPAGEAWGKMEFRRLQIALGQDPLDGEDEADYLNRLAGSTFGARIYHDKSWIPDGETEPKPQAKLKFSSVRPA